MQGCSAKGITIIRGNIQPEHATTNLSVAQIMYLSVTRGISKIKENKKQSQLQKSWQ